ncbi:MAG TPA: sugar ABC transporter ATP-binding protein [Clostridium sp.]
MNGNDMILKLENVVKAFPGVKALDGVQLEIKKGEIHALCGENGAGKSTLMKIISGAYDITSGSIYLEGKEVKFSSTKEAQNAGISMIYQEFNLIPYLSVAENLFLDRQPKNKFGLIDWRRLIKDAESLLRKVGLKIDAKTIVHDISVAECQMLEIAKSLSLNSKIIIMDEPTATLSDEEIKCLFGIIRKLKEGGISIIYISHRMEEIFNLSDRITILRDGKYIKTLNTNDTNYDEIVKLMVGKSISSLYPVRNPVRNDIALEVRDANLKSHFSEVSFKLHKGEILGMTGLMGAGVIHLSKSLFGCYDNFHGEVIMDNKKVNVKTPLRAMHNGISLVPDDRKNEGLVLIRTVRENITACSLGKIMRNGLINYKLEKEIVNSKIKQLNIKVSSMEQPVGNLSGGNQQKIVFAKVLETVPKILILDEPTRGVDVGAKAEIYQIMNELTEKGISIILVSTDLPELIGMSDRIIVMREGKIVKELRKEEVDQETILAYAAGGVE